MALIAHTMMTPEEEWVTVARQTIDKIKYIAAQPDSGSKCWLAYSPCAHIGANGTYRTLLEKFYDHKLR